MNKYTFIPLICGVIMASACTTSNVKFETLTCSENFQSQKIIDKFHPGPEEPPSLRLDVSFTFPARYRDNGELGMMQQKIVSTMFGDEYSKMEPKTAFYTFIKDYKNDYTTSINDLIDTIDKIGGGLFNWSLDLKDSIYFQNSRLLQFFSQSYSYMGGAHGTSGYASILFDLGSGQIIKGKDIFVEDTEDLKTLLLAEYLKDTPEFADDKETCQLIRDNIWTDDTDFAISSEGIYFNYSSYVLGYYALGSPQLFLPYTKLSGLIRQDSPVYLLTR